MKKVVHNGWVEKDGKKVRKRKAAKRTMLEHPDLRWKAGREPKLGKVIGKHMNHTLVETDLGLVSVRDSTLFGMGLEIPVMVEQGSGRLICSGTPRSPYRW